MCDASEPCPPLNQLSILEFIVLLVFEEFADLETGQLTTNVVLDLDEVEELEALYSLFDEDSKLVVVCSVHKLYKL